MTSSLPVATSTQASSSSLAIVMAMMPELRTFSNCSSGVFLTMPLRVAMTRNLPAWKSDRVIVAIGTSPGSTWTPGRLMMAMPLA